MFYQAENRTVLLDVSGNSILSALEGEAQNATRSWSEALAVTRFVVQKILGQIIVILGIFGNGLSIVVLSRRRMQSSTNVYLIALSVCDLLYLVFMFSLGFATCSNRNQSKYAFYFIPYGRVLTDLFGNVAVWLTVSFTVERYVGVRFPMKGRIWCTVRRAKLFSFCIFMLCLISTSPGLFELEIQETVLNANDSTVSYHCNYTEFSKSISYMIGYYWWFVSIFTFVPLLLLSIFNSMLINCVWQASKIRRSLANSTVTGSDSRQNHEQNRITLMLISVVIVFFICQIPWTTLLLYRTYVKANGIKMNDERMKIAGNIVNLLVQINASINFILYSFFSSEFRKTMKRLLCRWYGYQTELSVISEVPSKQGVLKRPLFQNSSSRSNLNVREYSTFNSVVS